MVYGVLVAVLYLLANVFAEQVMQPRFFGNPSRYELDGALPKGNTTTALAPSLYGKLLVTTQLQARQG